MEKHNSSEAGKLSTNGKLVAAALIVVGIALAGYFATRTMPSASKEIRLEILDDMVLEPIWQ